MAPAVLARLRESIYQPLSLNNIPAGPCLPVSCFKIGIKPLSHKVWVLFKDFFCSGPWSRWVPQKPCESPFSVCHSPVGGGWKPCWFSKLRILGALLSGESLKIGVSNVGIWTLCFWGSSSTFKFSHNCGSPCRVGSVCGECVLAFPTCFSALFCYYFVLLFFSFSGREGVVLFIFRIL